MGLVVVIAGVAQLAQRKGAAHRVFLCFYFLVFIRTNHNFPFKIIVISANSDYHHNRCADASWFDWCKGSAPLFWNWGLEYQREVRDGQPHFMMEMPGGPFLSRNLGKAGDVLFTVAGVPFWGASQFELLIFAIVLPLAHVSSYRALVS